jgi:hypothetical protein
MWMVGGVGMARAAHVVDEKVKERRRVVRRASMVGCWLGEMLVVVVRSGRRMVSVDVGNIKQSMNESRM